MRSLPALLRTAAALLATAALPAAAAPEVEALELQRNGALSRHLWQPAVARTQVAGLPLSAGLALGLRGAARHQLDSRVAPALTLQTGARSSLSLLSTGGGAMLVLQLQP